MLTLLLRLPVPLLISTPYHPQTCGKVERFHHTQKLLTKQSRAPAMAVLQAHLDTFRTYYNQHRPHRAPHAFHARIKAGPSPGNRRHARAT
ncbi:MAG: integrase core domain-containing protein [Candidatus Dormiibacterota bacterium]